MAPIVDPKLTNLPRDLVKFGEKVRASAGASMARSPRVGSAEGEGGDNDFGEGGGVDSKGSEICTQIFQPSFQTKPSCVEIESKLHLVLRLCGGSGSTWLIPFMANHLVKKITQLNESSKNIDALQLKLGG